MRSTDARVLVGRSIASIVSPPTVGVSRGGEAEAEGYVRFADLAGLAAALPPSHEIASRFALGSLANPIFVAVGAFLDAICMDLISVSRLVIPLRPRRLPRRRLLRWQPQLRRWPVRPLLVFLLP